MYSFVAGVVLTVAAPVPPPPPNVTPAPTGPAPVLVFLRADANGKVMVQVTQEEMIEEAPRIDPVPPGAPPPSRAAIRRPVLRSKTVELGQVKDLTIKTVDGRNVSVEEAIKRLEKGEVVLIAPAGQPISPAYLKVFKDDTLILSSPELIGVGGTTIPNRIQPRPVQIQPVAPPPVVLPAQPGGVIQIQIGPAVEAVPLPVAPAVPAEQLKKVLPVDQAVPDRKAVPPLPPANPAEKEPPGPEKQDK